MTTGKLALTVRTFVGRVNVSTFQDTLSRLVIIFLPKQSSSDFMAAVTVHSDFGAQEVEICHYFHIFASICHALMGPEAIILVFIIFSLKPTLSLSSFTPIKKL